MKCSSSSKARSSSRFALDGCLTSLTEPQSIALTSTSQTWVTCQPYFYGLSFAAHRNLGVAHHVLTLHVPTCTTSTCYMSWRVHSVCSELHTHLSMLMELPHNAHRWCMPESFAVPHSLGLKVNIVHHAGVLWHITRGSLTTCIGPVNYCVGC